MGLVLRDLLGEPDGCPMFGLWMNQLYPISAKSLGIRLAMSRDYQYEPLVSPDAVRILVLDPAVDTSAPLMGSMVQLRRLKEISKLHGQRSYSAMSYTWGEPNFCEQLIIHSDDELDVSCLAISMTVKDMLLQLRRPHKHRHLWIDAICLNQKDGDEKAQQIPLMGEIYTQADKVHIWLGPNVGDETARVFAFLRVLGPSPGSPKLEVILKTIFGGANIGLARQLLRASVVLQTVVSPRGCARPLWYHTLRPLPDRLSSFCPGLPPFTENALGWEEIRS